MNILHIQAGDLAEGAARGAYWLHLALRKEGIDSHLLLQQGKNKANSVICFSNSLWDTISAKVAQERECALLARYPNRQPQMFSTGLFGRDITKLKAYRDADILHMHWINLRMINIELFSKIKKPIVWTFRDMWPFTGGCHLSLECSKYESGCGACPQLGSHRDNDLSRRIMKSKQLSFKRNIHPVAISRWQQMCVSKSLLFKDCNTRIIYNGIDTVTFSSLDKRAAQQNLALPPKKIVLIATANANEPWKGFEKYLDALDFTRGDYFYVFFGHVDELALKERKIDYKSFGFLYDDISLRLLYSAADVFVAPCIQESFGKMLIEAMACGTPVVCFDATGPKDIVDHKINGYKAAPFDPKDLAQGIDWVLSDDHRRKELAKKAREKVVREFEITKIAKQYTALYEEILAKG